jgi:hypothetical protein
MRDESLLAIENIRSPLEGTTEAAKVDYLIPTFEGMTEMGKF